MEPALHSGQLVVFSSLFSPKQKSVVLSSMGGIDVVKRLHFGKGSYSLRGDNAAASTDYEDIDLSDVMATLIYPQK